MNVRIIFCVILLILSAFNIKAQWPGYFYAFELKDSDGNLIDSNSTNYKMLAIPCTECSGLLVTIKICEGNKTWHFYAGGNTDLYKTNTLQIIKIENGIPSDTMTIEFPPSLSGGKEKFYRDLYAGELKFKKGRVKIKLPKTDDNWDNLNEIKEKICRLYYAASLYYDISGFQK